MWFTINFVHVWNIKNIDFKTTSKILFYFLKSMTFLNYTFYLVLKSLILARTWKCHLQCLELNCGSKFTYAEKFWRINVQTIVTSLDCVWKCTKVKWLDVVYPCMLRRQFTMYIVICILLVLVIAWNWTAYLQGTADPIKIGNCWSE